MSRKITRRQMLGTAAAGTALCLSPGHLWAAGKSPNEKLNIAMVGCGGRALENWPGVSGENIVALCDADDRRAADMFQRYPKLPKFRDYRRMLDKIHAQIDAVVVSTPDHVHAPISLMAMRLGKHVYCEKPLCWSIEEARRMAEVAKQQKVATQMGTQGMSCAGSREAIALVRSGLLGEVRQMHGWSDRPLGFWPQGVDRPTATEPVPAGLDWDLWQGPAAVRPYNSAYMPFVWRGWKEYGTGPIGDMGIHNLAMVYMALGLGYPTSCEIVETSGLKQDTYPSWCKLRMEFPGHGTQPPLTFHWYDGGKKPPTELIGGHALANNGAIIVGTQGTLYSYEWTGANWFLFPKEKFAHVKRPTVERDPHFKKHYAEWIAACKGGPKPLCNFTDFASILTETMLIGCLAIKVGGAIQWDAATMRATNCPDAEQFIKRDYRKGWSI
jgi:predicted dehydrogenase